MSHATVALSIPGRIGEPRWALRVGARASPAASASLGVVVVAIICWWLSTVLLPVCRSRGGAGRQCWGA